MNDHNQHKPSKEAQIQKIRNRVLIRNIFEMMAYAFRAVDSVEYQRLESEDFDNAEDLLAAILTLGLSDQLRRGLEHAYTPVHDELSTIRGHIDMRNTAYLRFAGRLQVACEYDEFTIDTIKNRIIVTASRLLLGCPTVSRERALTLKRSLLFMRDIPVIESNMIDWSRLRFHRNNGSYRMLMGVCRLILEARLQTEQNGSRHLAAAAIDRTPPDLYEHFILEYFRYWHPELHANADVIETGFSVNKPTWMPQLKTDITLRSGNRKLIIDAKCYQHILQYNAFKTKKILSPANLNQIYRYVTHAAYDTSNTVSGMLLYAQTSDEQLHDYWQETGYDLYAWTLDLSQPFNEIQKQLEKVAALMVPASQAVAQ